LWFDETKMGPLKALLLAAVVCVALGDENGLPPGPPHGGGNSTETPTTSSTTKSTSTTTTTTSAPPTEARSYGEFTKQQNVQRVERVTRRSNISNISLGDTSSTVVTSYKKEYLPRNVGPCPAVLIDIPKGPFKHTRDTKSHKFYAPVSNK
jgi:hypothetical protein